MIISTIMTIAPISRLIAPPPRTLSPPPQLATLDRLMALYLPWRGNESHGAARAPSEAMLPAPNAERDAQSKEAGALYSL